MEEGEKIGMGWEDGILYVGLAESGERDDGGNGTGEGYADKERYGDK
jgi:hypothetical protein